MTTRQLTLGPDQFDLNGKPFRLIGGALHHARIPRPYWRDRFAKLLDLGANTVETYGFWNAHEPYPGRYDFSDMLDVVAFMELAGSMGLNVIYRPGPYCCAEWDMGGLPWWLLNEPGIQVRCMHPAYLKHVKRWFEEVIPRVAPLQSTRGGPLIAMQFENEYGYYGNDKKYLAWLRDLLRSLGIDVLLFTSDGTFDKLTIANGGLEGTLRTANFGSRATERFDILRQFQPNGPLVCMEFWVGWFDVWRNGKHATRPAEECAVELDTLLGKDDASAVIYMFQGGTNWGFTAGGNLSEDFQPFVTSYDYDALLNEAGDITPKFQACRDVIHKHLGLQRAKGVFPASQKKAYGAITLNEVVSLSDALPLLGNSVDSPVPLTMEQLGHGRGFVLYRTEISAVARGRRLVLRGMHDWCNVLLNGRSLGTWYRRDPQPEMLLEFDGAAASLEILVHNLARSNFGHRMLEPKGLTGGAFVGSTRHDERALLGWSCHPIPLDAHLELPFKSASQIVGPAFYRGQLEVDGTPADTFLSLLGFHLGCVFVNGFNVGRYWNVGPQATLYVPAPLLREGTNEIIVFEAVEKSFGELASRDAPQLDFNPVAS